MTATAFANDPVLDFFDDDYFDGPVAPARPQLRLLQGQGTGAGQGFGHVVPTTRTVGSSAGATSVETYRRRRFLMLVAVTALVLSVAWAAGFSVLSFGGAGSASAVADQAPAVHVVLPGDSYAAIAADLGADNPVAAAEQLRAANGGSELVIGQRLVVNLANLGSSNYSSGN